MQQVMENRIPFAAHTILPEGNHRRLSLELLAAAAGIEELGQEGTLPSNATAPSALAS